MNSRVPDFDNSTKEKEKYFEYSNYLWANRYSILHLDTIVIIVSFLLNIIVSFYGIVSDRQAFSLNKVFWIFNLLFLSLVPLGQFLAGAFPWDRTFSNSTILTANGLILLCQIVYVVVREKSMKGFSEKPEENGVPNIRITPLLLLYLSACLLMIAGSNGGRFWERNNGISIENGTLQLLTDKALRGICLFGFLSSIYLWQEKKMTTRILILLLLIGFIANFPTAIPRYWLATFYLGALLIFFRKLLMRQRYLFSTALVTASVFLFPLLTVLRYSSKKISSKFSSVQDVFSFSFRGGDFDAYSSLCSTIDYVQQHGITWGRQLATVVLFFIPRSVWPGKSVGSGALVNRLEHSDFTNFSSPYIAEGYINFGIIGSLVFFVLLAWLIARYDDWYWNGSRKNFNSLIYPAATGMLFFMLRGDLLSSFAYSVGIYFSGWLCYKICQRK
ncbi:MAG: O-antigen polysaccharide polymerase Wzy [Bacteroidota bacterium]